MFASIQLAWPGFSGAVHDLGLALFGVALGVVLTFWVLRRPRTRRASGPRPVPHPPPGSAAAADPSAADAVGRGAERVLAFGSNPACRYRPDTTLTWVNRACAALVGREPDDLIGSRWIELVDPAAADAVRPRIDAITAERPTGREEGWLRGPAGSAYVRWDQHGIFDDDGEVREVFALGTDLTQLRAALDELSQGEERLGLALDAGCFGMWDFDVGSGHVERNQRWHELIGRALGDVPATVDGWRALVHPDDVEPTLAATDANFGACTGNWSVEYRLRHRDGHWVWVEDRGRVVKRDADGNALRAVGVVQDVSERRAFQEQLQASRSAAQRESEAKGRFLANMSHEIRTPLTAVLGYAEVAREELADRATLDRGHVVEHLDAVLRNGRHLSQLIDEVLDLSKIEADEVRIERSWVDARAIVREACDMLRGRASAKNVDVRLDLRGALPTDVRTDALRVRQILVNLIGNAVKFSRRGSTIDVVVAMAPADASDMRGESAAELRVEVRDQAGGMDAATLARVFEPFVQDESRKAHRHSGTGLGLAISRRLASLLGGELAATSDVGEGSVFRLSLPLGAPELERLTSADNAIDAAAAALPSRAAHASAERRGRILLAEDGADNRQLIGLVLERAGYAATLVADGDEAVRAVRAARAVGRPFDLILMDVQMPVLDGYAATRILRADGENAPIVALTANAFSEERARSLDAGCTDHTTKPIARETFVADVQRWIEGARAALDAPTP